MAFTIARFAIQLQEPGDLFRQMLLDSPSASLEKLCWCSNFQSTNPECPENVQNWLKSDFQKRFIK